MIFVFGGKYQGKLDFVKEKFNKTLICDLSKEELDLSKDVLYHFEEYIKKIDLEYIKENIDKFKDKIIISDDLTLGLVPINKEDRIYRENLGRVLTYISRNSNEVYRVYFGIGERIK